MTGKDNLNRISSKESDASSGSKSSLATKSSLGSVDTPLPLNPTETNKSHHNILRTSTHNAINRSHSIVSRTGSFDDVDPQGFTEKEIYGDMPENEIALKRTETRQTILSVYSSRAAQVKSELRDDDEETQSNKEKPMIDEYTNELSEAGLPSKDDGFEFHSLDPELVTWDGLDDPKYPRNWSSGKKIRMTAIVALFTFVGPFSSSLLSPSMSLIAEEFNITNTVITSLVVSIYVLAWAICPLICAPLSEMYGRKIVLNISIFLLTCFNLGCGLSQNLAQILVFRFLAGMASAPPISIGAGVLADLYTDRQRNSAMAWYSIGPTLGPVIAPVISGFLSENCGWRWCFYLLVIICGICTVTGWLFLQETYSPTLLSNKSKVLRAKTGNMHLKSVYEISDGESFLSRLTLNVSRPIKLLFTHPMVFGLGLFMAFVYGFMYLMIVTFPKVWGTVYGFNVGIAGLMYLPLGVGYLLGILFWTRIINNVYLKLTEKNGGVSKPEFRIPCLIASGVLIPVGLIWYGWGAQRKDFWLVPGLGTTLFGFATIVVFQTIQNYLIDMNNRYSASAIASATVFRSLFGFAFPLFADKMYDKLHYGWGNTMCAFIALLLGVPFPLFVIKYGEGLRGWANKRMDREQAERDLKNLKRLKKKEEKESKLNNN